MISPIAFWLNTYLVATILRVGPTSKDLGILWELPRRAIISMAISNKAYSFQVVPLVEPKIGVLSPHRLLQIPTPHSKRFASLGLYPLCQTIVCCHRRCTYRDESA